ncbi:hypothetical protein BT69DRAFT_1329469 [Atractiella rhizophila]|nr:hypothetical protein BT69DRAFT_1329469 [Atractiella rhizophila]
MSTFTFAFYDPHRRQYLLLSNPPSGSLSNNPTYLSEQYVAAHSPSASSSSSASSYKGGPIQTTGFVHYHGPGKRTTFSQAGVPPSPPSSEASLSGRTRESTPVWPPERAEGVVELPQSLLNVLGGGGGERVIDERTYDEIVRAVEEERMAMFKGWWKEVLNRLDPHPAFIFPFIVDRWSSSWRRSQVSRRLLPSHRILFSVVLLSTLQFMVIGYSSSHVWSGLVHCT